MSKLEGRSNLVRSHATSGGQWHADRTHSGCQVSRPRTALSLPFPVAARTLGRRCVDEQRSRACACVGVHRRLSRNNAGLGDRSTRTKNTSAETRVKVKACRKVNVRDIAGIVRRRCALLPADLVQTGSRLRHSSPLARTMHVARVYRMAVRATTSAAQVPTAASRELSAT